MTSAAPLSGTVNCSSCSTALPSEGYNLSAEMACPKCQTMQEVIAFPALYRRLQAVRADFTSGTEANCFNHPQKKAMIVCEDCGRFLCDLCNIQIGSRHSCPACIDRGRKQGDAPALVTTRTIHDSISLSLAILPVLMWPVTVLTAPAALFYAIRHWRSPTSILPRSKVRYLAAIILAIIQIICWCFLLFTVVL